MRKYPMISNGLVIFLLCLALGGCASMQAGSLRQQGNVAYDKGKRDEALKYYLDSLQIDPDNATGLRVVGRLYYLKQDYEKAEEYLNKAVAKREKWWIAWNNLGWVFYKTKRYPEMRDAFDKAIEYQDDNFMYNYVGLAGAFELLGNKARAGEIIEKAIRLAKTDDQKYTLHVTRTGFAVTQGNYELAKKLSASQPSLGIYLGMESYNKGIIYDVNEGMLADLAGLKVGDVIIEVNGTPFEKMELKNTLRSSKHGDTLTFTVKRDGVAIPLKVVLDYDYYLSKKALEQREHPPTILPSPEAPQITSKVKTEKVSTKPLGSVVKEKLAVMDMKAKHGVKESLAEGLSVVIRDAIQDLGNYEVLSKDDVEMVAERTAIFQSLGCDDTQCLINIGRSLGTRFMVAGAISKFGDTFNISLRMIDTVGENAGVRERANRDCRCAEDELIEAARETASQLLE